MNSEQERRSRKWTKVLDNIARSNGGLDDEKRSELERLTEEDVLLLKEHVQQRFRTQAAQDKLLDAIVGIQDFAPPDNLTAFPRWKGTTGPSTFVNPAAKPPHLVWFYEVDAAREMLLGGKPDESFLHLCSALCRWAEEAICGYQSRCDVAQKKLKQDGASMSAARAERLPNLSGLAGSKTAAGYIRKLGLCSADEVRTLHASVDRFIQIADNAFPRAELDFGSKADHVTQLGRCLMYVFMQVGFINNEGAFYASALAARHGIALKVNSLKAFPGAWKAEQSLTSGEAPGPSELS